MYSVKKVETNKWGILELGTDMFVYYGVKEKDIRDMTRSLNLGAGFNGFTPSFFTEQFKHKKRPSKK